VSGVSCRDGHVGGLGDRGDERVVQWCVLGHPVGGEDSCGRKVEGQHPVSEGGQDAFFEPPAQDHTLGRVGPLFGEDAAFHSSDGRGGHELISDRDRRGPDLDRAVASPDSQVGPTSTMDSVGAVGCRGRPEKILTFCRVARPSSSLRIPEWPSDLVWWS